MKKLKLVVTLGVSASGKTTYAEGLNQVEWLNVNRDDIRKSIYESENDNTFHWDKWDWDREDEVTAEQEKLVILAKEQSMSVIISDTNLSTKAQKKWSGMAQSLGFELEYKVFHVTLDEAIKRDDNRLMKVGEHIIRRQYKGYQDNCKSFILDYFEALLESKWEDNFPNARPVLSDIDGTLAEMGKGTEWGRDPFDWHKVGNDLPRKNVIKALEYFNKDYVVLFLSGRDSCCYDETKLWLQDNVNVCNHSLYMRKHKDSRKDWLVKLELLVEMCQHGYGKPLIVFDDRNQVVETLRYIGLEVFQVAEGNF
tara:strand:- start:523 stop:1452 length:930 start_codon:yes stop_codon:yes gene_type:complete